MASPTLLRSRRRGSLSKGLAAMSLTRLLVVVIGASLLLTLTGCKSAQDRVLLGDDFYLQGDYSSALDQYRRARRKNPALADIDRKIERTQIRLLLQDGDAAVASARFSAARQAYEEVRRLDPGNQELDNRWARLSEAEAEWHFQRGQQFLAAGKPFSAIPELERTLEIQPSHSRAQAALDRARREQVERAARAEAAYNQGVQAQGLGQFEEAIKYFDRALELDPSHARAALDRASASAELVESYVRRGDASAEQGAWAEALDSYEKARSREPSSHWIGARIDHVRRELDAEKWIERGDRARERKDWQEAHDGYEQARLLTSAPERVQDRLNEARTALVTGLEATARAAEEDGRFDEALTSFRTILDVDPDHPQAGAWYDALTTRLWKAEAAYREGRAALRDANLVLARKHFRDCTEILPVYRDAAERLSDVRRELDLAETLYNRAREAARAGRQERAVILYEECLAITRPFRDAEERLEEAFAMAGAGADSYGPYNDGCRAQSQRNYERARTLLLTCQTERPGYRDVAARLEQISAALDRAATAYRRAEDAARRDQLEEARDAYAECLTACSPYRDANDRLAAIEASLALLSEAERLERERRPVDALDRYRKLLDRHPAHPGALARVRELDRECRELETDYALLIEAEQKKDYRGALGFAVKIRKLNSGYEDVEARVMRLETEADYADALSFEESGRWELAGRSYERCLQRDPKFRDAAVRRNRCREKIVQAREHGESAGPRR